MPVSNLSYLTQAGFAMQIKRTKISNQSVSICDFKNARKDRTDSVLACVAFFGIFHVRALCTTGWKPAHRTSVLDTNRSFSNGNFRETVYNVSHI